MPPRLGVRPASFAPALRYPTANANGPYTVIAGTSVLLRRVGSSDPYVVDGYDCYWLPGDGRAELGPYIGAAGDISVQYDTPGNYQARLRVVSQTTGLERIAYALVTVQSVAVVATVVILAESPIATSVGQALQLSAAAYDAAGNPITLPFTWATTDPGVVALETTTGATINVSAVAAGTADVTVTCGGVESPAITFNVSATTPVYQVVLTPGSTGGQVGAGMQFTATVTD